MSTDPHTPLIPADKGAAVDALPKLRERGSQRIYRGEELFTIGMPCGGIGAGQLYVRGDGTLACWQIDGGLYFTGVGHDCYRRYRPESPIAQGFILRTTDADGRRQAAVLSEDGYDAIEFIGEYPRALVRYRADADRDVPPVDVDLEVFSPFIPLDARNSAWPATVLRFTLRNRDSRSLDVDLTGWLENMAFAERTGSPTVIRRNRTVRGDGVTSLLMDATAPDEITADDPRSTTIDDFESGTYEEWDITGDAFGQEPPTGTLPRQQPVTGFTGRHLVNTFNPDDQGTGTALSAPFTIGLPYLTFRLGGGDHPGRCCINLIVDGMTVRTATGRNEETLRPRAWDVRDLAGREARVQIVDRDTGAWGHVNVDDIALTNTLPPEFIEFDPNAMGYGTLALSVIGDGEVIEQWTDRAALPGDDDQRGLIGAVAHRLTLAPGESAEVTFIISWHFPNLHTDHGRMYANWFADARDVAGQLAADLDRLTDLTRRFCDTYYRDTTLPRWLNSRLMMPTANLATGTAQWWRNGRFWGWEGVCCCAGTCTHVWNYAQSHAWLFPELARSARSMQDLGAGFDDRSGLVGFRSDRNFAADGQAGTILKCYREHLLSDDDDFLRLHWPRIRMALDYLVERDGNADGIIEGQQHNTFDINFYGANTFVGSLYLAALRAGEQMARAMDEPVTAARYRAISDRGRDWTAANLFNGEYYVQRIPPAHADKHQYGTGCLSDQVFGQNWAHTLDLGYVYPREQVRTALANVFKYNWAPDVGPFNDRWQPFRTYARAGQPGLFTCTWPHGHRPGEPVLYDSEVWTGIEYQVAAGLAWERMTDEALLIVHGIDQRYDARHMNPWNEVECGDHYARALAAWGTRHALLGFTCDGPAGRLTCAPRLQPDDLAAFFCTGTAWGTLRQQRSADTQINRIEVRYGSLELTVFETELPAGVEAPALSILRHTPHGGETTVEATPARADDQWGATLTRTVTIRAGEALTVTWRW